MGWYAVGVMAGDAIDRNVQLPVTLGGGVRVEEIPSWAKEEAALKLLSWHDRERIRDTRVGFALEYQADALGTTDPQWSGKSSRSIQATVDEKFALAGIALWVLRGSLMSATPVLHFDRKGDAASLRASVLARPILVKQSEIRNKLALGELEVAKELHEALLALPRDGTRWIAVRMLLPALAERLWETRYLLLWVVLEALFGPEDPHETTHRLAQRIALFLANRDQGLRVLRNVKEAYGWRSKTVHGARLKNLTNQKSDEMVFRAETYIRGTLIKLLLDQDIGPVFDSKGREEYLESLAFLPVQRRDR